MIVFAAIAWFALQAAQADKPVHDAFTLRMNGGVSALAARHYDHAAEQFQAAAALHRDDSQPVLLEGEALVYANHPKQAIAPLKRTLELDPDSSQAHELLAAAYAGADMRTERDAEIALLRRWHTDGAHTMLEHQHGFLLESFRAGVHTINTFAFFTPDKDHPGIYRFTVRDSAGIMERVFCVSMADAGAFTLARCADPGSDAPPPKPIKVYANLPDYSQVRADVRAAISASGMR